MWDFTRWLRRLTLTSEISLADCGNWHSSARFHWLTVVIDTHQWDFIGWLWRLTLISEILLADCSDWHSPVTFHWLIHCWLSVSPPPGLWPPSTRGSPSGSWSADNWFCAASSYTSGDRSVLPHCPSLFHPPSLCPYFQFDHYQIDLKYIHQYMKWNSIEIYKHHFSILNLINIKNLPIAWNYIEPRFVLFSKYQNHTRIR